MTKCEIIGVHFLLLYTSYHILIYLILVLLFIKMLKEKIDQ